MNSRLAKALKKLGQKCTNSGTKVHGDNVDGLLECIAEHYAGGGIITVDALPTENINTSAIYRVAQGESAGLYYYDIDTFAKIVTIKGNTGASVIYLVDETGNYLTDENGNLLTI